MQTKRDRAKGIAKVCLFNRQKWLKHNFVEYDLYGGQGRTRTIDKLDGARTKACDQMMPMWQHSCVCAMGCFGICRFLGQSLNCRIDRNCFFGEGIAAPSHERACAGVCAFLQWAWCALNRCPGHQCMQVCTLCTPYMPATQISPYISATQSLQGVHMLSCVRSLFIHGVGQGWGVSTGLCRALVAWREGLLLGEVEIEVLSCVFLFLTHGLSARLGWASFWSETTYRRMVILVIWKYFHTSFFTSRQDGPKLFCLPVTLRPDFCCQKKGLDMTTEDES